MSDLTKERVVADLQKAKETGGARLGRIRDIIQSAAADVFTEFKAGSGELGDIAKDSISSVSKTPVANEQETVEETVEASDAPSSTDSKSLILTIFEAVKDQVLLQFAKGYVELKAQAVKVDENLADRYGDRYQTMRQRVDEAGTWYNDVAAKAAAHAEEGGTTALQETQAEFEVTAGKAGVSVAQREQQIRQQLKQFFQTGK